MGYLIYLYLIISTCKYDKLWLFNLKQNAIKKHFVKFVQEEDTENVQKSYSLSELIRKCFMF